VGFEFRPIEFFIPIFNLLFRTWTCKFLLPWEEKMPHFVRQGKPLSRLLSNSRVDDDISPRNALDAEECPVIALGKLINHVESKFADDIRQPLPAIAAEAAKKRFADDQDRISLFPHSPF